MGQEILSCNKCGTKHHGDEFTRGRAFTIENRQLCQKCASINLTAAKKPEPPPKPAPQSTRAKTLAPSPVPPLKSRAMLYVGIGVVLALAAMGVVFA